MRKNPEVVRLLYNNGAEIVGTGEDLLSIAFNTASEPTIECVLSLYADTLQGRKQVFNNISTYIPYLFRGPNANILSKFIKLYDVCSFAGHESLLCRNGKRVHFEAMTKSDCCFDLQSALRYTIVYGRLPVFQYLMGLVRYSEQLDYVYRGPHGSQQTLLSLCLANGYYSSVVKLISAGANVNIMSVNERGETRNGLMAAVDNPWYNGLNDRDRFMVKKCVYYMAKFYDVDSENSQGQTALTFACRAGNLELVDILLELGATELGEDQWN